MTTQTQHKTELEKDAANLLFALSDAWPYVHGSCSIKAVRNEVSRLLQKHGDFADLIQHKEKVDRSMQLEKENEALRSALDKLYTAVAEKHQGTAVGEALVQAQELLAQQSEA